MFVYIKDSKNPMRNSRAHEINEYAIRQRSYPAKKKNHLNNSKSNYYVYDSEFEIDS